MTPNDEAANTTSPLAEAANAMQAAARGLLRLYVAQLKAEDPDAHQGLAQALQGGAMLHVEASASPSGFRQLDLAVTLPDGTRHHLARIGDEIAIDDHWH